MAKLSAKLTYNQRRAKRGALMRLGAVEKRPHSGNNVSHANNKTKRLFRPNLQRAKVMVDGKLVSVRIPASELRTLTKLQKERTPVKPKRRTAGKPAKKTAAK